MMDKCLLFPKHVCEGRFANVLCKMVSWGIVVLVWLVAGVIALALVLVLLIIRIASKGHSKCRYIWMKSTFGADLHRKQAVIRARTKRSGCWLRLHRVHPGLLSMKHEIPKAL